MLLGVLFSCFIFCNLLLPFVGIVNLIIPLPGGGASNARAGGGGGGGGGGGRLGSGGAGAFPELEVVGVI